MTQPWDRFPDVQAALLVVVEGLAGGPEHAGIETPEGLVAATPFIRVRRLGGNSDLLHDWATVEVDVFHTTYRGGEELAERVRQWLTGRKHRAGPAVLDSITCQVSPIELPWGPGIRRFGATYRVVSRRYRAAG
ncbi:hypothetical protein [Micromonospora sp. RV43]|uniref:hypothetical protein n=1 Tax=Micromonospora sp. RV43 TaxID=1661387 RepID=UPI00069F5A43|nr:hypothetical protein [Micromonospora sp. RV43]